MNDIEKDKIQRFMNDPVMSNAVYDVIFQSFIKNKGSRDVQILAAERISIDLLVEAWKELEKYTTKANTEITVKSNPGV